MRLSCISKQNEQKMSHSLSKIFCQIKFVIWGGRQQSVYFSTHTGRYVPSLEHYSPTPQYVHLCFYPNFFKFQIRFWRQKVTEACGKLIIWTSIRHTPRQILCRWSVIETDQVCRSRDWPTCL